MHLDLQVGSGDARLTMGASQLCTLRGALGSGRLCADLSGGVETLRLMSLKAGSGGSELALDGAYPALEETTIANASGMNTLLLRGEFPALQRVRVANASGRTELQLEGEMPRLDTVAVNSASGDVCPHAAGPGQPRPAPRRELRLRRRQGVLCGRHRYGGTPFGGQWTGRGAWIPTGRRRLDECGLRRRRGQGATKGLDGEWKAPPATAGLVATYIVDAGARTDP
jgi:hypothetical protein